MLTHERIKMIERISEETWDQQEGHLYRYRLAADWISNGETVLDIASGIGYGAAVMKQKKDISYHGVDKVSPSDTFAGLGEFIFDVDLDFWDPENLSWDVSVSFETIEHVKDPVALSDILKKASRLVVLSTPTRPTKHINPYHLHDFTVQDVLNLFSDCELIHLEDQPNELSHIFVFATR
jgi:cyclopropane fatty-acyl-phospholipid synthase-like methyltransferase